MSDINVKEATKKPNIVVIMVDDLGYSDLGCYGGENYPTTSRSQDIMSGSKGEAYWRDLHRDEVRCSPLRLYCREIGS